MMGRPAFRSPVALTKFCPRMFPARVVAPEVGVARSFEDYKAKIAIDRGNLPAEVKLLELHTSKSVCIALNFTSMK